MSIIIFDYVPAQDLPSALEIEHTGFIPEEAGTATSFSYRQANAPNLFLGAYQLDGSTRTLVGYVCATQTPEISLTHASMSHHVPGSATICIHSVCVAPSQRKKGLGLGLLEEYIKRAEKARADGEQTCERIVLIAHEDLVPFYEKAGFENLGKSSVVHGPHPWFELRRVLSATVSASEHPEQMVQGVQQIPAGVYEALQRRRTDVPSSRMIYDFSNGVMDVIDSTNDGASLNKFDLLCPRAGCGSIILKKGVATWVERESEQLEPAGLAQNPHLPALPTPPETAQLWLVTGSPMVFENIGFTRPVRPLESGLKMKLLTCGECDLGPLGWSAEGTTEYWLACSRVSYRG